MHQLAHIACLQHDCENATRLVERATLLTSQDLVLQAMTYFIKGTIAGYFDRWTEAEEFHRHALELRRKSNDQRRVAWSLLDLSGVLRAQKRYRDAIGYCKESATILRALSDMQSWCRVQMSLGLIYYDCGDAERALSCFESTLAHLKNCQDLFNLAKLYTNIGLAFLALDQPDRAEESFAESKAIFLLLKDKGRELNAADGLAMALLAQKRYIDAIASLQDSIAELCLIKELPIYDYLVQSMRNHLEQAQQSLLLH
ncbi:MAG: tetratricopeptide repeat protein [Caldilineaceae bacterium]